MSPCSSTVSNAISTAKHFPLIQRQQPASAGRTYVLVMKLAFRCGEAEVEPEFVQYGFQIVHMHLRGEVLTATPATGRAAGAARILIKGHSQRQRALNDVEQFSKRQIQQKADDAC